MLPLEVRPTGAIQDVVLPGNAAPRAAMMSEEAKPKIEKAINEFNDACLNASLHVRRAIPDFEGILEPGDRTP